MQAILDELRIDTAPLVRPAVTKCRLAQIEQTLLAVRLTMQKSGCREIAARYGHQVVRAFGDQVSGNDKDRCGLNALLSFLEECHDDPPVVIVRDASRLSINFDKQMKILNFINDSRATLNDSNRRNVF